MKKMIIGIFLIIVGGIICFLCARTTGVTGAEKEQIETAVVITDGTVDPANEGKIVMVGGTPTLREVSTDPQLNISFNAPLIRRTVEAYMNKGSQEEPKMQWTVINFPTDSIKLVSQDFYGSVTVGNFSVSGLFLKNCADIELTDFASHTRESAEAQGYTLETTTEEKQLITQAPGVEDEDNISEYTNALRISYQIVDPASLGEMTFVGTQRGGALVATPDFCVKAAKGISTDAESMIKALQTRSTQTTIFGFVVFLACIIVGTILIYPTIKKKYL